MYVSVLGPVEVELGGVPVDLGPPKQRALVALLALWRGRPVPVDTIVETVWPRGRGDGVVAVQDLGEQLPAAGHGLPRGARVGGRCRGCLGEGGEVTAEAVVHHVHHRHVDGAR